MTASGLVGNGSMPQGKLLGFIVNSGTTVTVALNDGTTAGSNSILPVTTPSAGVFTPMPVAFGTGLYATLGGTSPVVTFVIAP